MLQKIKIAILGNSGSGKSTLAIELSEELSIPVYHIDKILWQPNWIRTPENDFIKKHNELLEKEEWILDGVGYKSTFKHRFEKANIIIYLDIHPEICFQRAKKRMEEDLIRPNPYVTKGCRYIGPDELQLDVINSFHNEYRPMILEMIEEYKDKKRAIILEENFNLFELFSCLKNKS